MFFNRDELLSEAAEAIVSAAKFSAVVSMLANDIGINISASLQLNIRDAMFHFVAMSDTQEDDSTLEFEKNYFNLKEHLSRGKKDAVILFAQDVCNAVMDDADTSMYENVSDEECKQLQHYCHNIKNVILEIRLGGRDLSGKIDQTEHKVSVDDAWKNVFFYTSSISKILQRYNIKLFNKMSC